MHTPAARLYLATTFAHTLFANMIFTVLAVYYVQTVGLNALQLVLVGTVLEATILLFEIPTGVVADLYSRRLSVILGFALIGLCYVVQGLMPLLAAILIAEFIRGVGETFLSGAFTAWIADEIGDNHLGRLFLRSAQLQRVGGLLGIAAGTGLAALSVTALPIVLGGALHIALSMMLMIYMQETGFQRPPASEQTTWHAAMRQTQAGLHLVRGTPILLMFVLIGVLYGSFSEGFDRLWEAHFLQNFYFPPWLDAPAVVWIGLLNASAFIVSIAIGELLIRRLDLNNNRRIGQALLLATILLIGLLILFALTSSFVWAAIAYLLIRALRSVQEPLGATWLNRNIPTQVRATVLSLIGQTDALGQIAGGPVVGAVGLRSIRIAMLFSACLLAPVIAMYGRHLGRTTDSR